MIKMHFVTWLLTVVTASSFPMNSLAVTADKVVIVPLLGGAVGDAVASDVIKGKTFSSQAGSAVF